MTHNSQNVADVALRLSFLAARQGAVTMLVRVGRPFVSVPASRTGLTLAARTAGLPDKRVQRGELTTAEWQRVTAAYAAIADAPLWIHERPLTGLDRLPGDVSRAHAAHGVRLVVLDSSLPAPVVHRLRALTRSGPVTVLSPDVSPSVLRRLAARASRRAGEIGFA
ncbi:hypothetical protein ACFQYP_65205 [Nonomuraea antimicrobica]